MYVCKCIHVSTYLLRNLEEVSRVLIAQTNIVYWKEKTIMIILILHTLIKLIPVCYITIPSESTFQLAIQQSLKLVTAHAQLLNFKMAAIIFVGVFTTLLWLIHCGAKEKERYIIGRVKAVILYNGDT